MEENEELAYDAGFRSVLGESYRMLADVKFTFTGAYEPFLGKWKSFLNENNEFEDRRNGS